MANLLLLLIWIAVAAGLIYLGFKVPRWIRLGYQARVQYLLDQEELKRKQLENSILEEQRVNEQLKAFLKEINKAE